MESKLTINDLGVKVWKNKKGLLHRENGPAIIYPSGRKTWWINGKRHRENGPALIYPNEYETWYLNGKIHRENGPARIFSNGTKEWWLDNIEYSKTQYQEKVRKYKLKKLKF